MSLRRLYLKLVFTFFINRAIFFLFNIGVFLRCLQTLLIHFFLSVLLIACCGNMTPHAIDYGKAYKNVYKKYKPNVLALLIGLVSQIQLLHWFVSSRNFASSLLVKKPWDGLSYIVLKNQIYLFNVESLIYLFYILIYLFGRSLY